jgi:hypothetical protein
MTDDTDDDVLSRRLDSALRGDLGSGRVDVGALLTGTRNRARTVRNQRVALAVAAAAVVLAVPAGYEVLDPRPGVSAPPAAMIPGAPVTVADRLAFTPTQLPAGLVLSASSTEGPRYTLTGGSGCAPATGAGPGAGLSRPRGARSWAWTGAGEPEVDLTVSRWAGSDAARAVRRVVSGSGGCTWSPVAAGLPRADEAWTSTATLGAGAYGRVVLRSRDLVAVVQVRHPDGPGPALDLALDLARIEATNLG